MSSTDVEENDSFIMNHIFYVIMFHSRNNSLSNLNVPVCKIAVSGKNNCINLNLNTRRINDSFAWKNLIFIGLKLIVID